MTNLLEVAIAKLKTLSVQDQDAIAAMILEELEDEVKWDRAFAQSEDKLASLASLAIAEYRLDKTEELNPETL